MAACGYRARLAVAFLFGFLVTDASADLASAIAACKTASDNELSTELIADLCPGLIAELEMSPVSATLGEDWREELAYFELPQLEFFLDYYEQEAPGGADPSLSALDDVVAGLGRETDEPDEKSLWERFIEWLNDLTGTESNDSPGWLSEWLSDLRIPASTVEVIFWVLSALTVAAAVAVILVEIRAARKSVPRGMADPHSPASMPTPHTERRELTLDDLDDAALREKPSVLLRLFLQRMDKLGILSSGLGRTHRELRATVGRMGHDAGEVLARLADSAEKVRFGDGDVNAADVEQLVSSGVTLLHDFRSPGT